MMWNQQGSTYAPYRNAQRMANRLQPRDMPEVDPFAERPEAPPVQTPDWVAKFKQTQPYAPNRPMGGPTVQPYGQRFKSAPMGQNPALGQAIMGGTTPQPKAMNPTVPPTANSVQNPGTWDTDGWATPSYLGKAAGGPMAGWDQKNWDDPNMQTPKYVVGRILSNYQPSEEGLNEAMKEISQAYPGATFDGKDKITIPGLGVIDVLVNAGGDAASKSWAWQDQTNTADTMGPLAAAISTPTNPLTAGSPITDGSGDAIAQFMQDPKWREMLRSLGIQV